LAELKKRLAALEALTKAAPRVMQVQHDMIRKGEPLPAKREGITLHIIDVLVSPDFSEDASLPARATETVTIDAGRPRPPAPRPSMTRMPFLRH